MGFWFVGYFSFGVFFLRGFYFGFFRGMVFRVDRVGVGSIFFICWLVVENIFVIDV